MTLRPAGFVLLLLLAAADATAGPRVLLDRITWSPDGAGLALEATLVGTPDPPVVDTLLVDLSRGAVSERNPAVRLAALAPGGTRLAVASRFAILAGPAAAPESLAVLSLLDPALGRLVRIGFSPAGDSVMALRRSARFDDVVGWDVGSRRETLVDRTSAGRGEETWRRRTRAAMSPVTPAPFGTVYERFSTGLFFVERSMTEVDGLEGAWLYDLHFRDERGGSELLLARNIVPFATLVSADSSRMAIAVSFARPDYGGGLSPGLIVAATDGSNVFTVLPEGAPAASRLDVNAMSWNGDALWFTTPEGLFRVDPASGRARRIAAGPAPPAWSGSLAAQDSASALVFTPVYADTSAAVPYREELRRSGFPAWILRDPGGGAGFRVAVGGTADSGELESWGAELERFGHHDFAVQRVAASLSGLPFPYGSSRGPDQREAFLISVGPPGLRAQELWITERNGARRIRLIRAMGPAFD